jgi:perosamine synthetase
MKLALHGGEPVRSRPFPAHPVIGEEEKRAVMEVLESGRLSTFIAAPGQYFLGGKKIKEFEKRFAEYHGVERAVAFNSATAALHAAVVGIGVEAGDEVVVPPYTFTSTATCALMHNAIPVFADI